MQRNIHERPWPSWGLPWAQSCGLAWVGRDFRDHLVPTPRPWAGCCCPRAVPTQVPRAVPTPVPRTHVSCCGGAEVSAKSREQNLPLSQSKQTPGGARDEGVLSPMTNLNKGNNELDPKAPKHCEVRDRLEVFRNVFPILEAVSKREISASSLPLFPLLPPPLAQPQSHHPGDKTLPFSCSLSLFWSILLMEFSLRPHPTCSPD